MREKVSWLQGRPERLSLERRSCCLFTVNGGPTVESWRGWGPDGGGGDGSDSMYQGRYMGYMRQLKPRQKVQVRRIREAKGVKAAIVRAKQLE